MYYEEWIDWAKWGYDNLQKSKYCASIREGQDIFISIYKTWHGVIDLILHNIRLQLNVRKSFWKVIVQQSITKRADGLPFTECDQKFGFLLGAA